MAEQEFKMHYLGERIFEITSDPTPFSKYILYGGEYYYPGASFCEDLQTLKDHAEKYKLKPGENSAGYVIAKIEQMDHEMEEN